MRTFWTSERDSAYRLCEQALQIDPQNIRALSHLSFKFTHRVAYFASPDRQADLRRADELASLAIKIDPDYHMAHAAKGDVLLAAGRYREAIDSYGRALMLAPKQHSAWIAFGLQLMSVSRNRPSPMPTRRCGSVRTTPVATWPTLYLAKAIAFGILQDYEEALVWIERAEAAAPRCSVHGICAVCAACPGGQRGRGARNNAALFGERQCPYPDHVSMECSMCRKPLPSYNPLVLARLLMWGRNSSEGLRKAGLPE